MVLPADGGGSRPVSPPISDAEDLRQMKLQMQRARLKAQADEQRRKETKKAGNDVHQAGQRYQQSPTETNKKAYVQSLNDYNALAGYNLRVGAQDVHDREAFIRAEIARQKREYKGSEYEKKVFSSCLDDLQKELLNEKPKDTEYKIKRYEAVEALDESGRQVQKKLDALNAFGTGKTTSIAIIDARDNAKREYNEALQNHSAALGNLIDLDIDYELSKMKPEGPGGQHTPAQWKEAGDKVKKALGAEGDFAAYIDTVAMTKSDTAKIQHLLDQILKDPASLSPNERALAEKDPVTLAFLKAAGIKLDDPSLSPEMKALLKQDPILFGMVKLADANIWISDKAPVKPNEAVELSNGNYLYVTVKGKPLQLTPEQAQLFELGGDKNMIMLADSLAPALKIEDGDGLGSLMNASDIVRSRYATDKLKGLMTGPDADPKAAISFLGTQMPGFFSSDVRGAFWNEVAKPYVEPYLRAGVDGVEPNDDAMTQDPYLWALGVHMHEVAGNNTPAEVDALLADIVMEKVDGYLAKEGDSINPSNVKFLTGLAALGQGGDELPGITPETSTSLKIAQWVLKPRDNLYLGLIDQDSGGMLAEYIGETGNANLGDALVYVMKGRPDEFDPYLVQGFEWSIGEAKDKFGLEQQGGVLRKQYDDFMANREKILTRFFGELAKDDKIGAPIEVKSDTELRNLIGKTLGLTPANREAYDKLDYSQEWYSPENAADWAAIMTAINLLEKGGFDRNRDMIEANLFKHASKTMGVRGGGFFTIHKPDGDTKLIDITAAKDAVWLSGGQVVSADDMQLQYIYDDVKDLQEHGHYAEGYFFISDNVTVDEPEQKQDVPYTLVSHTTDLDGGDVPGYQEIDSQITTAGERFQQAAAYAGLVALPLSFVPGLNVIGWGLLAATSVAGIGYSWKSLNDMSARGASTSWSNPGARQHWMNIAGNSLGLGRIGLLKLANNNGIFGRVVLEGWKGTAATKLGTMAGSTWGTRAATFMGAGASYVGFSQTLTSASHLASHWDQLSDKEKIEGVVFTAAGLASLGLGGIRVQPTVRPTLPNYKTTLQTRTQQIMTSPGNTLSLAKAEKKAARLIREELIDWRADAIAQRAGRTTVTAADKKQARSEFFDEFRTLRARKSGMTTDQAMARLTQTWLNRRALPAPLTYRQQVHQWVQGMKSPVQFVKDKKQAWTDRWQDRGNAWNQANPGQPRNTYQIRLREYVDQAKATVKTLAYGYAGVNLAGAGAWFIWNIGMGEDRRDGDPITVGNVENELKQLQQNPDKYLDEHYDFEFALVVPMGDDIQNFNGHLLAVQKEDGSVYYFRRVPQDMYDRLKEKRNTDKIEVTERLPYSQLAGVLGDQQVGPLQEHKDAALGMEAYRLWVQAGRPDSGAAAKLWLQTESEFGQKAYDLWDKAGKPTSGDDSYWGQAQTDLKGKIDDRARKLWEDDGSQGNGPTSEHKSKAQQEFEDDIGFRAYELWSQAGGKADGAAGSFWKQNQAGFQEKTGGPAYQKWADAGKPTGKDDAYWGTASKSFQKNIDDQAVKLWEADGKPVEITVEIRPPYRGEWTRDAGYSQTYDGEGPGFRWRPSFAIGPIEGQRPHADFELTLGYRYTADTQTTVRVGAPSPTQGWGIGVRQQDTTFMNRVVGSVGTIDLNKSRVVDLDNPDAWWSGKEWMIMNGRVYVDTGNRNRLRLDYAGRGSGRGTSSWAHDKSYVRARETGFLEIGLGADFLKYVYGDGEFFSVNGYYELQWYPADLRAQVNLTDRANGPLSQPGKGPGFQPFPQFEIDPALQFTSTEPERIFELPEWLSPKPS